MPHVVRVGPSLASYRAESGSGGALLRRRLTNLALTGLSDAYSESKVTITPLCGNLSAGISVTDHFLFSVSVFRFLVSASTTQRLNSSTASVTRHSSQPKAAWRSFTRSLITSTINKWSDRGKRHGRACREGVPPERCASRRDTITSESATSLTGELELSLAGK
jgi:hypothetical protein